jgi:hypothetical protein
VGHLEIAGVAGERTGAPGEDQRRGVVCGAVQIESITGAIGQPAEAHRRRGAQVGVADLHGVGIGQRAGDRQAAATVAVAVRVVVVDVQASAVGEAAIDGGHTTIVQPKRPGGAACCTDRRLPTVLDLESSAAQRQRVGGKRAEDVYCAGTLGQRIDAITLSCRDRDGVGARRGDHRIVGRQARNGDQSTAELQSALTSGVQL